VIFVHGNVFYRFLNGFQMRQTMSSWKEVYKTSFLISRSNMPLFTEYTLSLLDNDKISVDFADTISSDYERAEMLRFFKKYKREVYIDFDGDHIFFMVLPWRQWVEFLISSGFEDTAKATTEILNDLDIDRPSEGPSVDDYIKQLKNATVIKDDKTVGHVVVKSRNLDLLKEQEIKRLTRKEEPEDDEETDETDDENDDEDAFVKF
jgi:hypothetical protein